MNNEYSNRDVLSGKVTNVIMDYMVAYYTLFGSRNFLVGPIFSPPIRMAMGMANKTSLAIYGQKFTTAAAAASADDYVIQEIQNTGILYLDLDSRPTSGSFVFISAKDEKVMLDKLKNLLPNFERSTPVDVFFQKVVKIDQDHISTTPLESQFRFPSMRIIRDKVRVLFRVSIIDPMFTDDTKKNLNLTEVPQKYIEGVLNTLNPAAFLYAYTPTQIQTMLERAGKNNASIFEFYLKKTMQKWLGREAPKDMATLKLYLIQGLFHEFTHALAINMPDDNTTPATLPQTEQDRLRQFSMQTYREALNTKMPELRTSVVYTKNLFKALEKVKKLEHSDDTQNLVVGYLTLEMFCDRFGMYMYEAAQKIQAYIDVMGLKDISVDMLRRMEKQRLANPEAFRILNEITSDQLNKLDKKIKAAETEHVYISAFGDPAILESERTIFEPLLNFFRDLDRENNINVLAPEDSKKYFVRITQNNTVNTIGVNHIVANTERANNKNIVDPVGLAVSAGEKIQEVLGITEPTITGNSDPAEVPILPMSSAFASVDNNVAEWFKDTPAALDTDMTLETEATAGTVSEQTQTSIA